MKLQGKGQGPSANDLRTATIDDKHPLLSFFSFPTPRPPPHRWQAARQLTVICWELFDSVTVEELLGGGIPLDAESAADGNGATISPSSTSAAIAASGGHGDDDGDDDDDDDDDAGEHAMLREEEEGRAMHSGGGVFQLITHPPNLTRIQVQMAPLQRASALGGRLLNVRSG